MTKEEAIRIIKIVLAVTEDFEITVQGEELTEEKCKEAVKIATEALEQESKTDALDKIRAEIKGMLPTYHNADWSITDLVPISEVLKLVDKYKAESEE